MTYTDASGKRVRLWIKEEVSVPDKQLFMDDLVGRIETILRTEPINIYVNPTFLPECIAQEYDQLWTRDRMLKVINAAAKNHIAIEINNRYRIPSEKFIRLAKKHGVKFAFGTNNSDSNMGDLDYCLLMKKRCGLKASDMFVPASAKSYSR
jgi:histidinol phosphatase-like PHP family hydrolase